MTPEQFNNIFQDTIMELEKLVVYKGGIYANEKNRLHNFDRAAEIQGISPIHACQGMWTKQLTTLIDAIKQPYETWTQDRCDKVINDLLVYLILTKALFYRTYGWETKSKQTPQPLGDLSHGSFPNPTTSFPNGVRCMISNYIYSDVHRHIQECPE